MNTILHETALAYASKGVPVFPCAYGRKVPSVSSGFHAATTAAEQIRNWFDGTPLNIAIPTGKVSGRVVIDDDSYKEGGSGFFGLVEELGPLPETFTVRTRAGGLQYHFAYPDGYEIRSRNGVFANNVDIKADGGYVMMPPSWVDADEKGCAGTYEIVKDMELAPLPKAWADKISSPIKRQAPLSPNAALVGGVGFEWPDRIRDGEGREDFVLRAAGYLRGRGTQQDVIETMLLLYNTGHIHPPLKDAEVLDRCRRYEPHDVEAPSDVWPEPQPIDSPLPDVPTFELSMLPEVFAPYVEDEAERMQAPADYVAIPLMVAAAAALGNSITIAPKERDTGWQVAPVIWGGVVGRPGSMKSPSMAGALGFIETIESGMAHHHGDRLRQFEVDKLNHENAMRRAKKAATVTTDMLPIAPEEPQPERLLVNDTTVQKLGEILRWSPKGVLVTNDELTGLLEALAADGQEAARGFYLTAWNGNQSYRVDRVGRGSFTINKLALWVLGGIQPSKLQSYVRHAVHGGGGDDGLLQRFQLLVWPDQSRAWVNVDRPVNLDAKQAVEATFKRMRSISAHEIGATASLSGGAYLHFTNEAQQLFNAWRGKLEMSLRNGDRHPAFESHLSKYRSLVPALALVIHLADGGLGPVDLKALRKAVQWSDYLFKHARRVYASVSHAAGFSAKTMADKLTRAALPSGFTARDVYRKGWQHLNNLDDVRNALDWLVDANWLRVSREATGGRPVDTYYINPRISAG
jgi:putative DNA primase/helicase